MQALIRPIHATKHEVRAKGIGRRMPQLDFLFASLFEGVNCVLLPQNRTM